MALHGARHNRKQMSKAASKLRSKGRGDDTILAHITPTEAAILKRLGGSGKKNPKTGLPEFGHEDSGDPEEFEDFDPSGQGDDDEEEFVSGVGDTAEFGVTNNFTSGVEDTAEFGVTNESNELTPVQKGIRGVMSILGLAFAPIGLVSSLSKLANFATGQDPNRVEAPSILPEGENDEEGGTAKKTAPRSPLLATTQAAGGGLGEVGATPTLTDASATQTAFIARNRARSRSATRPRGLLGRASTTTKSLLGNV